MNKSDIYSAEQFFLFVPKLKPHFILYIFILFSVQFVDEKVQWMHIDMAGPVWNEKKKSATGFGVSTLVEWVLKNSA